MSDDTFHSDFLERLILIYELIVALLKKNRKC